MPCFKPLKGYRTPGGGFTLHINKSLVHNSKGNPQLMEVSCGQCIGCRLKKSREWAIRCIHEHQLHEQACFITLTYDDEHVPDWLTLKKSDFQKFLKRLRKNLQPKKLRYYMCGEYGEHTAEKSPELLEKYGKLGRPHYHAILFGHDWDDLEIYKKRGDVMLYTSKTLTDLWGMGHASTGSVTLQSAAYVARYTIKKITGKALEDYSAEPYTKPYERVDKETGELFEMQPEYTNMSLKPGIGHDWFEKYAADVFMDDFVIHEGRKIPTPNYYFKLFEKMDPDGAQLIKAKRIQDLEKYSDDLTYERLETREYCQQQKLNRLKRTLT